MYICIVKIFNNNNLNLVNMKKNSKLQELVANQISNALETVKESEKAATKKTSKKSTKSATKAEKPAKETPKEEPKKEIKKIASTKKASSSKKAETIKEVAKQQKAAILEEVVSKREVKYLYPEDVVDTLARKKWRQQTRNELHRLEREMHRITDTNCKEYKAAKKAFEEFQAKVLKPNQIA